MGKYWNHNTAFHEELVEDAKIRAGRVLDIGCGDGLLLQRLVPFAQQVIGFIIRRRFYYLYLISWTKPMVTSNE